MRHADPFTPFLHHEDIRERRVLHEHHGNAVDDFLDAPDRATIRQRFAFVRLRTVMVFAVLLSVVCILRLFDLQIVRGAHYRDQAETNRVKREVILAPRGIIFDRFGTPLTVNEPAFLLTLIPNELPANPSEKDRLLATLAEELSIDRTVLDETLRQETSDGRVNLDLSIPHDQAIQLLTRLGSVPGVLVTTVGLRTYTLGSAAAHVLGYMGKPSETEVEQGIPTIEHVGKTGLELYYQDILAGVNGVREIERDSANREQRIIATERPVAGRNIQLTIDAELQRRLAEDVERMVRQTHSSGGAAVAIDPRTGEILALVSAPAFDPSAISQGLTTEEYRALVNDTQLPLFNRAVAGEYPSGSTIKPFIAAAALDERIVTPQTQIASTGGIAIGQWFFPDWKAGGHGTTTLTKAIAESVNTYFYTIGGGTDTFEGLGIDRMTKAVKRFGFGKSTKIDLPGERPGFLPSKDWKEKTKGERWYIGDTYHFAIGQGDLLVTPLQLALGTATIANGGTVYRPHLVKAIFDQEKNAVSDIATAVLENSAAGQRNIAAVRQAMRETVVSGSAQALNALPIAAAGKTGTAEFGPDGKTHAWFTAFAPVETPTIALSVIIEGGGEGHAAALPVARNILSWYFTRSQ